MPSFEHTIIPVGHTLKVTTWENDADNYRTNTLTGLSFADVAFRVALLGLFRRSRSNDNTQFGNMYDSGTSDNQAMYTAVMAVAKAHPVALGIFQELEALLNDSDRDEYAYPELLVQVLEDMGVMGVGDFYTRVYSSHRVLYNAEQIEITQEDRTNLFPVKKEG